MQSANTVLSIIRERGSRGLPLCNVYRLLYNPGLYLHAYGRIARNAGALTAGTTSETADGMDLKRIQAIIELLKAERYRWSPVRRVFIEKKGSTNKRALGIPTWSDKLLQEVIRLILDAYYDPQFSERSHGFRPGRGCHTALSEIHHTWMGTVWLVEGDISACFDSLDHSILLATLREKLHDNRFLRLIENLLKAGYLEEWRYHRTLSGSPQGGIVSPILANLYLDRLDKYVEQTLIPLYTRGDERKSNPAYTACASARSAAIRRHQTELAEQLLQEMRSHPSVLTNDPDYRRLRYIRYADDFLLGFAGPRQEAEDIKHAIGTFLRSQLNLQLSPEKTLVTHGRTEMARFLGYDLHILQADDKCTHKRRILNAKIGLRVPADVIQAKCRRYLRHGKPIHRPERTGDEVFSIIHGYELERRGIVEYYRMAYNLHHLSRLKWVMEVSLVKTLAHKLRISVYRVYRRYRATKDGRKVLQVIVPREGKRPLVATWNASDMKRRTGVVLNDMPASPTYKRTELAQRLLADTCELCGSQEDIEVHHIHALKDLKRPGRRQKPEWAQRMAARQRKTLVVCHQCHRAITHGKPRRSRATVGVTG